MMLLGRRQRRGSAAPLPSSMNDDDYVCSGSLGKKMIGGKLVVPDGASCTLRGTHVQGNLVIGSRATLHATRVHVRGGVQGEGVKTVVIRDSYLGNGIQVNRGEMDGAVKVLTSRVQGDVQLQNNQGKLVIRQNQISGSVQVHKSGGKVVIARNLIQKDLDGQDNRHAPEGGKNTAQEKKGQCEAL